MQRSCAPCVAAESGSLARSWICVCRCAPRLGTPLSAGLGTSAALTATATGHGCLSDLGDNKISLLERGGMFIPKIRKVSSMLPKSHHTPVPALPAPRGSQSARVIVLDPTVLFQLGSPGGSHIAALTDPSPRTISAWLSAPGILGWARISWQGLDPLLGDSALHLCPCPGLGKSLSTCKPSFVSPSVSVITSFLSHLQRRQRAPPHPYFLAITFLVSCFLTIRPVFIFYLFCPQCLS